MGNFYLIGEVDELTCLAHYNIHTEEYKYVDYEFSLFFKRLFASKPHMENEAYGRFEFPAVEQFGTVAIDECLAFEPALVFGGQRKHRYHSESEIKRTFTDAGTGFQLKFDFFKIKTNAFVSEMMTKKKFDISLGSEDISFELFSQLVETKRYQKPEDDQDAIAH